MPSLDQATRRLARQVARPNTISQAPNTALIQPHILTVTHVDQFSGVVGVQFPDPSGNGKIQQGVRYVQSYTPGYQPAVDHTVLAHEYGGDLWVVGQLIAPTNFITL